MKSRSPTFSKLSSRSGTNSSFSLYPTSRAYPYTTIMRMSRSLAISMRRSPPYLPGTRALPSNGTTSGFAGSRSAIGGSLPSFTAAGQHRRLVEGG